MTDQEKLIDRIKKLLALGTSPNQEEANAAIAKANELMLRHNVTMRQVEGSSFNDYQEKSVDYDFMIETKWVRAILKEFFFVQVLLSPGTKTWSVLGTSMNVEIALYMHQHIRDQFKSAWKEYKEAHGLPGLEGKTEFMFGAYEGLKDKLIAERDRLKQEEGLIWVGDPRLQEYLRNKYPKLGSHAPSMRLGKNAMARESGFDAGQRMNLHHGIKHGATKVAQLEG